MSGRHTKLMSPVAHLVLLVLLQATFHYLLVGKPATDPYAFNFQFGKFASALVVVLFLASLIQQKQTTTAAFLHLALASLVTPSFVLWADGNFNYWYALTTAVCFITLAGFSYLPWRIPSSLPRVNAELIMWGLSVLAVACIAAYLSRFGLKHFTFNPQEGYEIRAEMGNKLGIFGYVNSILTKTIIPFAIAIALGKRRWTLAIILTIFAICAAGATGHKSMAVYPFMVAGTWALMTAYSKKPFFPVAIAAVLVICAVDMFLARTFIGSVLVRRGLMTPALINGWFIDFFNTNPTYNWAASKITLGLLKNPYDLNPPFLIAKHYTGRVFSANTGWIGAGYAQFGLVGGLVYSAFIGAIIGLLNEAGKKVGHSIVVAGSIPAIYVALTTADLLTAILSHGLGLTILIVLLMRPQIQSESFQSGEEVVVRGNALN